MTMAKFNAEQLQDMFSRVERKDITKEDAAAYYDKSIGSINNYFYAKNNYDRGLPVSAQNISTKAFTPWAAKYGTKGDPIYRHDPHPERKHTRKQPEQQKMILPESEPCEKETIEICGLIIEISIKTKGRK